MINHQTDKVTCHLYNQTVNIKILVMVAPRPDVAPVGPGLCPCVVLVSHPESILHLGGEPA